MKNGFVFGKFMPLHAGHLSLINFAVKNCDILFVVLCYTKQEIIPGELRLQWLKKALLKHRNISVIPFEYDQKELPNTSISSRTVSVIWAKTFKDLLPHVDVVFTSEDYGDYVAEVMCIEHICYDKHRVQTSISGSKIRKRPFRYWNYISNEAKQYFVKKVSILGSESTGKSILTERLATHYNTVYVSEAGREIVEKTELCTLKNLNEIASIHAKNIISEVPRSNKLLFLDTDLNITKSYCSFLFKQKLNLELWQEEGNKSDLCIFLETDCPFVQDGTRLNMKLREDLNVSHKRTLSENHINYISITGTWEDRFNKACNIINRKFEI